MIGKPELIGCLYWLGGICVMIIIDWFNVTLTRRLNASHTEKDKR